MKVLVIRFSSIGDIILTTPVLRCLKIQRPDIEIHYLTRKSMGALLTANPHVGKVHVLDGSLSATIALLKTERFDLVIDLHHNLRTAIVKFRLGVPSHSFNKLNIQKWLLVTLKINRMPAVHIVDRYLDTVKSLGVKNDGGRLEYYLSRSYSLDEFLPESHLPGYVAIAIGGQHATKRMPAEKIAEIAPRISHPVVLLGGKEDAAAAQLIAEGNPAMLNLCGQLSLDASAYLVSQAMHVITHDTGLMHIAAAFNKPITSIWGNTVPEFGMVPYRVDHSVIAEVKGLSCRPCSKIGYEKCPLGHFKCMNEQDLQQIAGTTEAGYLP